MKTASKEIFLNILGIAPKFSDQSFTVLRDLENQKYSAHIAKSTTLSLAFRSAKTTSTKTGQFVTLWQRGSDNAIHPYHINTAPDYFVIYTYSNTQAGYFLFSKITLAKNGVISTHEKEGKRAIRIYPPWSKNLNNQAAKTQKWQSQNFYALSSNVSNL